MSNVPVRRDDQLLEADSLDREADRIEAAWKRERDELIYAYDPTKAGKGRLPDGSAYALEAMREHVTACHAVGNAAALREAVVALLALDSLGCDEDTAALAAFVPGMVDSSAKCLEAFRKAKSALASPARNCDRFADELDAQLAFLNDVWLISVDRKTMLELDKYENWTDEMRKRYGRWLLAPAAEEGAGE